MKFIKRLSPDPREIEGHCAGCHDCPDIWELEGGDFAVIGADITHMAEHLPASAGCGPDERMVKVPRKLLVLAKPNIPDRV